MTAAQILHDTQIETVEKAIRSALLGDLEDDGPLRIAALAVNALAPWLTPEMQRLDDFDLPGMWESADFEGGKDEVRP